MTLMPAHMNIVADTALYVAIDVGSTRWQLAMATRLKPKVRRGSVKARDLMAFREAIDRARERLGVPEEAEVRVCHEAGRDGFWFHRWLEEHGFVSVLVDPGSVERNGRARRAKTDRLDAEKLLNSLLRWYAGDEHVWSVVRAPSREAEDARLLHRRREARIKDRTRHRNRIASLLATRGIKADKKLLKGLEDRLDSLVGADGRLLSEAAKDDLRMELELLRLCEQQIAAIDRQMYEQVEAAKTKAAEQVAKLMTLCGLGVKSAWVLVHELFAWRTFDNRKQLAGAAGLVPTPRHSDQARQEQGISKAGNRRVRAIMNQLGWLWLRYQPDSELTRWYMERWGRGSKRLRRIGIVALTRKLLIALWRYLERSLVPTGARIDGQPRLRTN